MISLLDIAYSLKAWRLSVDPFRTVSEYQKKIVDFSILYCSFAFALKQYKLPSSYFEARMFSENARNRLVAV